MTRKERLVGCDILDTYNRVGTQRNHLVDQLHGIAVGQQFANLVHVHYRLVVRVVDGRLHLVLANLLAHLAGKLVVDGVARTCGNDATLDGFADEGHIADNVEQFVTCAFVLPHQRFVLDIAQLVGVAVLYAQLVSQPVQTLLRRLTLVDDNSVVHITALDEVSLQQGFNVAHEDKGARSSDVCGKLVNLVEGSKLRINEFRLKRTHGRQREFIVRKQRDARARLLVLDFNLLANDVEVLGGVLFNDTHLLNALHILDGRAVEDGELRTIDLDETVVDAQSIERSHTVFYRRYTYVTLTEHGAALGVCHIFSNGFDDGFTLHVDTLNLIARILWGRVEGYCQVQTCMQAFAIERKAAFQCFLFHSFISF